MTAILDRVPVDEITAEARQIQFGKTVLLGVAAVLFGLGWVVGKTFVVLWRAFAWSATAVKVGWREAQGSRRSGGSA
ncbi:hypothetical protein SD37_11710 [Amycolatopsis orientalis]|uniref:Uncharacterized protein n=1 Tax=Amycolatopsis orientalis TaxID=31958 RepID=A0A193BVP9_AMYOR|nr:hypothetical protein [Amycolatopsis orientalis]ANN16244.1 hypothetical protein SD37_11710 [Amycolatopsis orientalis]